MPTTQVSDIIVPEVFNPYVINRTMELSALYQSGIIEQSDEYDRLAQGGGRTVNMPHFNDLSGEDEVDSDTTPSVPGKIGTGQDVAVRQLRRRSWSTNDLAATLSGADPSGAIGDLVAKYWDRRMQAVTVSTLKGVFAAGLKNSHENKIAVEAQGSVTDTTKISGGAVVDTVSKLGDAHEVLRAIVMHSVPYFNLVKQDLIEYIKDSQGNLTIPTYLGKRVIVDDGCPVEDGTDGTSPSKKYTSYLFGGGFLGYGEGAPEHPTETDRDILAGDSVMVTRKHFILHPRGIKWNDANVSGHAPTNAELQDAANWSKVYENKKIKVVSLITNG
ncbi:major capsid protein [Aquibacillus rhizosphaerae]|uniref:Major capsid protein n=1 Tax=Aquibacillus rhizosphaerae TaxID=3051431 RepID=A0ABT7LE08_9BACI|nr:major capsid protein [Aquibacillus sp. LR5S19]MDL4842830.1 major capsid protein [Aquibacillus sp. LR5S19]